MGLVVIYPGKGTFVKKVTTRDMQKDFPVRTNLEGLAVRLAAPRLTTRGYPEDGKRPGPDGES